MKYKIEFTETLQKTIEIEACSDIEALRLAKEKYYNEEIILDETSFIDAEINIIN